MYVYTMAVDYGQLFVGTEDFSLKCFPQAYLAADGDVAAAESSLAAEGYPGVDFGAQLWCFYPDQEVLQHKRLTRVAVQPTAVTLSGGDNPLNMGFRTIAATSDGLILGTSSSSNILTDPNSPLRAGGWELLRLVPTGTTGAAVAKGSAGPAEMPVLTSYAAPATGWPSGATPIPEEGGAATSPAAIEAAVLNTAWWCDAAGTGPTDPSGKAKNAFYGEYGA
jgi:hypothetical protein